MKPKRLQEVEGNLRIGYIVRARILLVELFEGDLELHRQALLFAYSSEYTIVGTPWERAKWFRTECDGAVFKFASFPTQNNPGYKILVMTKARIERVIDTHQKAFEINLDATHYGSFAELTTSNLTASGGKPVLSDFLQRADLLAVMARSPVGSKNSTPISRSEGQLFLWTIIRRAPFIRTQIELSKRFH